MIAAGSRLSARLGISALRAALLGALAAGCSDTRDRDGPELGGETPDGAIAACSQGECEPSMQPLVLLLVDTSGSMEYKSNCACETPGCLECWPDCAHGEHNRFADVLEVLGGSWGDFSCAALPRDAANGASYDEGYFLPYHRPDGDQNDDGLIDRFGARVRFALATFDSMDTYKGSPPLVSAEEFDAAQSADRLGMWSYNLERSLGLSSLLGTTGRPIGQFRYPGSEVAYSIDTGIRSAIAAEGALLLAADPTQASVVRELHAQLKASLRATRPYGGTPIAAALDDLYYLMDMDMLTAPERALPTPKHIVLLTDGRPDWDYRDLDCQCGSEGDAENRYRCLPTGVTLPSREVPERFRPEEMYCPYPWPEDAAYTLRCGRGSVCDGPVDRLSVVAYSVIDDGAIRALDLIAIAGGSPGARFANTPAELREQLATLFEEIASQ